MAEDSVAAYAAAHGWKPAGLLHSAKPWFDKHPDALADAQRAKEYGLSRQQILTFLQDKYGFPFTSEGAVAGVVG